MTLNKTQIFRKSEIKSTKGSENSFSGNVKIDNLFPNNHESKVSMGTVTFDAKAKTAWHTHPKGQILIITSGSGQVQEWGSEVKEVQEGDVVWFPPNIKHWHGASETTSMSHIAISLIDEKESFVEWLEKV